MGIWQKALISVAHSTRPDANVVGGHLVKTYLSAPPISEATESFETEVIDLLKIRDPTFKAVATAHHLLTDLESQLRIAEVGRGGLLVVSVRGPFYPLLNILRTLLHDSDQLIPSQ